MTNPDVSAGVDFVQHQTDELARLRRELILAHREIDRREPPLGMIVRDDWQRTIRVKALARQVLVVATTRIEGGWKAYCDRVPGRNHENEWEDVLREGDELDAEVARVLFPEFAHIRYAR